MTDVESPPAVDEAASAETPIGPVETARPGRGWRSGWKVERRLETPWFLEVAAIVGAILVAIAVSAILIALAGSDVLDSYRALYNGAFGTRNATIETLVQATPLIFTGLAAAFAFRAKVWNIGGEGQLWAGTMGAFWASLIFAGAMPRALLIVVVMAFAAVFGALWAGIAAVLRTRFGVNEIIATVMLNFVIINVLSYLLSDVWQDPASFYYQSERMPDVVALPRLFEGGRLHLGFVIALAMAAVVWFILERTSFGYEVRSIGVNPRVASYGGIISNRIVLATMLVSGAIAGLAGGSELTGIHLRLQLDIVSGLGFTGIIIALVARLRPLGVVAAAIVAGAVTNGATTMQLSTGVPAALVDVLTGLTLVFVLIGAVVVNYRLRRVSIVEGQA
ncbi:MAG: ABC transporter permease [Actinomycetota bacterium]